MKSISLLLIVLFSLMSGLKVYSQTDADVYWLKEDFSNMQRNNPDLANVVSIQYIGNTVNIMNPFSDKGISVSTTNGHVVINSTIEDTEVSYLLSGFTSDGSFKIYGNYKFNLNFNGVSITNPRGAAINIQSKKKVTVILHQNTVNTLIDGNKYTMFGTEDMKGAFFSEGQLEFNGEGSLFISGNYKHAICCDDYIKVNSGTIIVPRASSDGIHSSEYFEMNGGHLTVSSGSDGVESESGYLAVKGGEIKITTTGNGSKGIKSSGNISLSGGKIDLFIKGNAIYDAAKADITSPAGIKCDSHMLISGSCILNILASGSAGKGINIDSTLVINGGDITIQTQGNLFKHELLDSSAKGIKAQGLLTINAGSIKIKTSTEKAEGIESKKKVVINGGKIEIESYDDPINSSEDITINNGELYCFSQTNDGIDSNGSFFIRGGLIVVVGGIHPEQGFDNDGKTFIIDGGTLVAVGGGSSTPKDKDCKQRSILYHSKNIEPGLIHFKSDDGKEILTFHIQRTYKVNMSILFSNPEIKSGTNYHVYLGGSVSGGSDFHGLYSDTNYSGGTEVSAFTSSSTMVTTVGTPSKY